jgi:hypothetical protein
MDFYRLIPGVTVQDNGVRGSFAGLEGFGTTNIQRDGIDAAGGARWTANALTATHMNPDLIGELKIIVAPVDAELGRGNAQLQFLTRSGTNRLRGSAVWNVRNSALDANTWGNNNDVDPVTGAWSPTAPDWHNVHNLVGSVGGPIIKNKTFFFVLYDQALVNIRTTQNPLVLTPCARNGIFRYFDEWNNGNALQVTTQPGNATPTIAVVDGVGKPLQPTITPNRTPFTGALRYVSVFGNVTNVPTQPDCSDAVVSGSPWDVNRTAVDSTGFVSKLMGVMPLPNNYEIGDGLNTAGHRWVRREKNGNETIFSLDDEGLNRPDNLSRKQINLKIDHNFNDAHKLSGSYTYEHSYGVANFEPWPEGFRGQRFRKPQLLSVNFTSTLTPNLINEFRSGMRRTGGNSYNGLEDPDSGPAAQAFFPNIGGYPTFIGPGTGQVNFQTNQMLNSTAAYNDVTSQWSWADTLSWSRSVHTFKFGGELRRGHSLGKDAGVAITSIPRAIGGDAPNAAIPTNAIGTNIPGLAGSSSTGNNQRMRNLLTFLSGSLNQVTQFYYMQDPNRLDGFESYLTYPQRVRDTHRNEFSVFFKDDWKVRPSLTLNLGIRWDYYGSIYDGFGMMPQAVGGGSAIFGVSGRGWDGWWKPGMRDDPTAFEYVGPNSPNPDKTYFPNDYNNFGPAVGFAWQVPWFGAGKTTVRGGYQITYNGLPSFNSLTQTQVTPGSTLAVNYQGDSGANAYLNLAKLSSAVPAPVTVLPMQPVPLTDRTQQVYIPAPDLVNPYVQNITFSVTRSIRNNMTVDVRYLGTLGRKQWNAQLQINQPNYLTNGLKEAFDAARAGSESALLDQIFNGINIAGTGYGPVGTTTGGVVQTGALHLRNDTRFRTNLANGNYTELANTLDLLNYATSAPGNGSLPAIPALINGAVLRYNGFPENFIRTNPQFGQAHMLASVNSNNYHAMSVSFTMRPTQGISLQSTYTWSKNFGVFGEVGRTYTDPRDRHADYALLSDTRIHDFRTNGTFALPFGPNRTFFSGATGALARIIEDWSMSWIVNLNSGAPITVGTFSTGVGRHSIYANGTPDVVGPFDFQGQVSFPAGTNNGVYFMDGKYRSVRDPQCGAVTTLSTLNTACTLNAIADAETGQILLQNPRPGERGNVGMSSAFGPGRWRFDGNIAKQVRISETKSLQFRLDATNVFNHPEPNFATGLNSALLNINQANFGILSGANAKTELRRQFQAQLRFMF